MKDMSIRRRANHNERIARRVNAIQDISDNDLQVALGEEFYVGMGAQRLLGHQVLEVFKEWLANPAPSDVPSEYQMLADQANLGERLQVCLTVWLDHMSKLAEQRHPRFPLQEQAHE